MLNEQMYTTSGEESLEMMQRNPDYFEEYHQGTSRPAFLPLRPRRRRKAPRNGAAAASTAAPSPPLPLVPPFPPSRAPLHPSSPVRSFFFALWRAGFREQTAGWPERPIDLAAKWLKGRPKDWRVADLGCGDAELEDLVPQTVFGFDLVARKPSVTACDLAKLPLKDDSIDAAVFCLALMGTNYGAFVDQAVRALRPGGELWVAEVQSRRVRGAGGRGRIVGRRGSRPAVRTPLRSCDARRERRWVWC